MVIGADHAALEDGEEVFSGVAVRKPLVADVLLLAVVDGGVGAHFKADLLIHAAFVGHQVSLAVHVCDDKGANVFRVEIGDMEATDVAFALDQRDNDLLFRDFAPSAVLRLTADVGFIGFDDARGSIAAKRAIGAIGFHGLANAVAHEPRGLVGDAQHTFDLLGAHALLGRAKQVIAEQPFVKGNLRALKDGADGDGILLAAIVALDQARAVLLALKAGRGERTTVRTERALGPADRFEMLASFCFVVKVRGGDVRHALFYAVSWAALSSI